MKTYRISKEEIKGLPVLAVGYKIFKNDWTSKNGYDYKDEAGNEHKKNGKSRYEILAETHPKVYDYVLRGGKWTDNPYYDETAPAVEPDGWVNWNPKKIWVPSETGLGMKFVFDEINKIYGKDFIKY